MTDRKKQVHRINKAVEGQSIKRIVFLLVLVWAYSAFGATKYVATDGNDTAGDGSIGNPWLTIQYAFSQINSGDTIKVGAGTYCETEYDFLNLNRIITATIESQSGSNDVWVKPNDITRIIRAAASGTFTFNHINFMPIGINCSYLFDGGTASDYSVTFNDCVLDMNGIPDRICYVSTGTGESVTFNGCTLIADNVTSPGMFSLWDFDVFEVNDCDITVDGSTGRVFRWTGDSNTLKIVDCNINANGVGVVFYFISGSVDDSLDHLIITGNTATGFGRFISIGDEDIRFAKICDNTLTSTANGTVFNIGLDSGMGTNTLSGFVIKNNTLIKDSTSGHLILLGTNCCGAELSHNIFLSEDDNDYGIVIKGNYNNVHHNICKSAQSLYLYEAQYNKVQYNTFYSIGGPAFYWSDSGTPSKENVITNNIFDASGGGNYAMSDAFSYAHCDNYIDYNCYKAGKYGAVKLEGTIYNTLSELQAKWAEWSDTWPQNDAHSIIADPQFLDPANDDFRLKPDSPCLNAGEPTAGNGYTDIGAWQAIGRSELLLPNCIQLLEMDFNGDCKVDFYDFALFSLSWLDCNLDPPELCWE